MQEIIELPERGWSVKYAVKDGYGINRSFDFKRNSLSYVAMLPSRSEINMFIMEQGRAYFSESELGDFLTSELMSGTYFDVNLRKTPTPMIVGISSGTGSVISLTPADVIDSWLRVPEMWDSSHIESNNFEYNKSANNITSFEYTKTLLPSDDGDVTLQHIALPRSNDFIEVLFPSNGKITLASYSLLLRYQQAETVMNILDSCGVTASHLEAVFNNSIFGPSCFESLFRLWTTKSVKFGENLRLLIASNGKTAEQVNVDWLFAMALYDLDIDVVERVIAKGGTMSNTIDFLDKGVPADEVENYIGHDIDPRLAGDIYVKVSA